VEWATPVSHRTGLADIVSESGFMSQASLVNTLVGPFGLRAVVGVVLALFAAFIYLFNYTSFF
jgi:hypothetical protein